MKYVMIIHGIQTLIIPLPRMQTCPPVSLLSGGGASAYIFPSPCIPFWGGLLGERVKPQAVQGSGFRVEGVGFRV